MQLTPKRPVLLGIHQSGTERVGAYIGPLFRSRLPAPQEMVKKALLPDRPLNTLGAKGSGNRSFEGFHPLRQWTSFDVERDKSVEVIRHKNVASKPCASGRSESSKLLHRGFDFPARQKTPPVPRAGRDKIDRRVCKTSSSRVRRRMSGDLWEKSPCSKLEIVGGKASDSRETAATGDWAGCSGGVLTVACPAVADADSLCRMDFPPAGW